MSDETLSDTQLRSLIAGALLNFGERGNEQGVPDALVSAFAFPSYIEGALFVCALLEQLDGCTTPSKIREQLLHIAGGMGIKYESTKLT